MGDCENDRLKSNLCNGRGLWVGNMGKGEICSGLLARRNRSNTPLYPMFHAQAQTIVKIRHTYCYSFWRRNLSHNSLSCQIPSVSSEKLAFPHLILYELSRLRCHGHSLLFSSYLYRIKRKENSLLLDCPASEPLRRAIFGTTSSIFDLWKQPLSSPRCIKDRVSKNK